MKRRLILGSLLVVLALVILPVVGPARAQVGPPQPEGMQPEAVGPIKDLADLLNYPYDVQIVDLADPEREAVLTELMARPEAVQLRMAMSEKGFTPDLVNAEAMQVMVDGADGTSLTIRAAVVPMVEGLRVFLPLVLRNYTGSSALAPPGEQEEEAAVSPAALSAYLVAMVADDGTSFFQAHHTNLDPRLADLPDSPIMVNGMPYFYVTALRSVNGRIVYWRYWWFDSHHHPNWYYACYQQYWLYYAGAGVPWPWWHHWVYGWYYWRFWYYWSTWFPWTAP